MNKYLNSIVFFFLFSVKLFSQITIKGFIKDSKTKASLAFATVQFQYAKNGLYTNEEGYFEISSNNKKDTLIVSYLSYEEKKIPVSQLNSSSDNIIFLTNSTVNLSEVIVKGRKHKSKGFMFGHYDFPTTFNWGSGPAYIFMNYYKNTTASNPIIKKLYFDFGKAIKTTHKSLIRVRVMVRESEVGEPTKDVIQENMIVEVKPFTSKLIYDIEKYNIAFPSKGIFIGVEIIGVYRKGELTLFGFKNHALYVNETQDSKRIRVGEAWNYSPFDRKWFTNYKKGYNRMWKFGMELEDLEDEDK